MLLRFHSNKRFEFSFLFHLQNYQDDFTTPGISPFNARLRKQSRQMPNFRRNARGRPHRLQRLCCRDENFGLRLSLTLFAVVAIDSSRILSPELQAARRAYAVCRNGIPKCCSSAFACWSSLAVVTMVTFMPFNLSTLE